MEYVLTATFEEESYAYKALSDLKTSALSYSVLSAGILESNDGHFTTKDGFVNDDTGNSWATGGLLGGIVGILGGPLGVLLGSSLGMLTGDLIDIDDISNKQDILDQIVDNIAHEKTVLLMITQENNLEDLDTFFTSHKSTTVQREEYAVIQKQVYVARETEKKLKKQVKRELKEEKKKDFSEKLDHAKQEIKERFSKIGASDK